MGIIYWQYPGEDINRIIGADSYEVQTNTPQYGTEHGKIYLVRGKAVCSERTPPERYTTLPLEFSKGEVIEVYLLGARSGGIYNWRLHKNDVNANSLITYLEYTSCNVYTCYCQEKTVELPVYARNKSGNNVRCKSEGESINEPVISLVSLHDIECIEQPQTNNPCRNEITDECIFKIFADGNEVYSRTESVCPQVWEEQQQCPFNTCAVDCHGKVCCYNNQGIATYQYLKS